MWGVQGSSAPLVELHQHGAGPLQLHGLHCAAPVPGKSIAFGLGRIRAHSW